MSSPHKFVVPFLRWAGGKRWLGRELASVLNNYDFENYYEPFLGGAAVFFSLNPVSSVLSDVNAEVVNCYEQIRSHPLILTERLSDMVVSRDEYYRVRSQRPSSNVDRAVRMLYLNRTCFNGLYRTNRKGEFNVPYGSGDRDLKSLLHPGYLESVGSVLENAKLIACDFEDSIKKARKGDLIYCDPAYTVAHDNNGFVRYNETVFSWQDQIRLRRVVNEALSRGATILVSNACHSSLLALYYPFRPLKLSRWSTVGAVSGRREAMEYLVILSKDRYLRRKLISRLEDSGHISCDS